MPPLFKKLGHRNHSGRLGKSSDHTNTRKEGPNFFALRQIMESYIDKGKNLFVYYTDFEKAFAYVWQTRLWDCMACFLSFFFLLFLFCFVLFCFCFVLFCFVLFCFVLFCFVLFCFVLFCFVLFCFGFFIIIFASLINISDSCRLYITNPKVLSV